MERENVGEKGRKKVDERIRRIKMIKVAKTRQASKKGQVLKGAAVQIEERVQEAEKVKN